MTEDGEHVTSIGEVIAVAASTGIGEFGAGSEAGESGTTDEAGTSSEAVAAEKADTGASPNARKHELEEYLGKGNGTCKKKRVSKKVPHKFHADHT